MFAEILVVGYICLYVEADLYRFCYLLDAVHCDGEFVLFRVSNP